MNSESPAISVSCFKALIVPFNHAEDINCLRRQFLIFEENVVPATNHLPQPYN